MDNHTTARQALDLFEERFDTYLRQLPYCDQGVNAYEHADRAARRALKDIRYALRRKEMIKVETVIKSS